MIYDVVIIGAGPCGLAVAARLREKTPSALFTTDEHARYWHKHKIPTLQSESKQQRRELRKKSTDSGYASADDTSKSSKPIDDRKPSVFVLDRGSDQWMETWKARFDTLQISHLRSPLFFHTGPQDRDGLLSFAHETGRTSELVEIANIAGQELSKHQHKKSGGRKKAAKVERHLRTDGRDQIDYFTPSTKLSEDFCGTVIKRYGIRGIVHKACLEDVKYDGELFTLTTDSDTIHARTVVIATGASCQPYIPRNCECTTPLPATGVSHIFDPLTPSGKSFPRNTNIIVAGGGLTSAQLADRLLRTHSTVTVHLLIRRRSMQIKPFDVSSPWVTKTRNTLMSTFWSADTDAERLKMLQQARNGGSITPVFAKILKDWEAKGRLRIHCGTKLTLDDTCVWNMERNVWTYLNIEPRLSELNGKEISHVYCATGVKTDVACTPVWRGMSREYPIEVLGGLPVLNEDLAWSDDVPLYFTGALAALELGPGAANLMGARAGAERIAWAIEERLQTLGGSTTDRSKARNEFTGSFSNQFEALVIEYPSSA